MIQLPEKIGSGSQWLRNLQAFLIAGLLLYWGRSLLIPLFFGLLIAMVMYPVCKWLEGKGIGRSVAIMICLSLVGILIAGLLLLLLWQVSLLRQDMPELAHKLRPFILVVQDWIRSRLSIAPAMQHAWLQQAAFSFSGNAGQLLQATFSTTAGTLLLLFLVPVHATLFLFHRGTFVRFLHKVVGDRFHLETDLVLRETIHTYFSYIKGMIVVYLIVGLLNSMGLMALGVRHAILFGMLTAIMTIIPYVGIVVSALLPITVAFITNDSIWYPVGVVLVFSFVQYLEANIIFPRVVGAQLNVSTWATLIAIFTGGIIWGVSGMVLFIPLVAILKIISDHVPGLEALNLLLNRSR